MRGKGYFTKMAVCFMLGASGAMAFLHVPRLGSQFNGVAASFKSYSTVKNPCRFQQQCLKLRKPSSRDQKMILDLFPDPNMLTDYSYLSAITDNLMNFAQNLDDGSQLGEMLEGLETLPGSGVTEILEEVDEGNVPASVRNSIVLLLFKNPIFKALLGTQAGWGLVLVFSLVVIGQSFETLKEKISESLPERYLFWSCT